MKLSPTYDVCSRLYSLARVCELLRPGCLDGRHLEEFEEAWTELDTIFGKPILPLVRDAFGNIHTWMTRVIEEEKKQ